MANDYQARIQTNPTQVETPSAAMTSPDQGSIDFDKVKDVFRRSLPWMILVTGFCIGVAYLFVRYTKNVYQSHSDIKLNFKSEASQFGFGNFGENGNLGYLSGEIELLRSRLFFSQVIKSLPLEVSYYNQGTILSEERYRDAAFTAHYTIRDEYILDRKFMITVLDAERYLLNLPGQTAEEMGQEYRFGETISTPALDLRLEPTVRLTPNYYGETVYFIINSENALINYIEQNLVVRPLNVNANTIRVSFSDYNRNKARDVVQAITSIYQSYTQTQKQQANQQKIEFLDDQLTQTESRLDRYEQYFETFTIENKTTNLGSDLQKTIQQIVQLDTLITEARYQQKSINRLYTSVMDSTGVPASSMAFPSLNPALSKLQQLTLEAQNRAMSYDERTLAVRRIRQQLQIARDELLDELELLRERIDDEVATLVAQRTRLQASFVKLPAKGTEFNQAQRFYKLYEEFYLTLMQRKAEFEIAQAGTTTEFVILTPATMPLGSISPNRYMIWGIGLLAGLAFSFGLMVVLYLMHNTITKVVELERLTNTPVLGAIPSYREEKLKDTRMVISENPKSSISEAFRSLRTNMEFLTGGSRIHTISITSTISGEGKTFVSANLGGILSLSKQRVVIVDLDMRRPRVHLAFGHENNQKGTSTILIQRHTLKECIVPSGYTNLDYVPVGPIPPNPSELLLGGEFEQLIEDLKAEYDVVIFDTPPIGLVTDGVLVMKKVDLPIYVFRANYSKAVFARTLDRMRSINKFKHMALLLNAVKSRSSQGYGYNYGYQYGYYQQDPNTKKSWFKRITRR